MVPEGETDEYSCVRYLLVSLCDYLMLTYAGTATWAPWHRVMPPVYPATVVTTLESGPYHVIILITEGVVTASDLWHP